MEIKRATEIFVQTRRRFIVRQPNDSEQAFCSTCGEAMLAAESAAFIHSISRRAIYQLIETGAAHFVETETGAVLICPPSLRAAISGGANQSSETGVCRILETGEKNEK